MKAVIHEPDEMDESSSLLGNRDLGLDDAMKHSVHLLEVLVPDVLAIMRVDPADMSHVSSSSLGGLSCCLSLSDLSPVLMESSLPRLVIAAEVLGINSEELDRDKVNNPLNSLLRSDAVSLQSCTN